MDLITVQTTETDRAIRDAIDIVTKCRRMAGNNSHQEAVLILLNARVYLATQLSIDGFVQEVSR